MPDLSESYGANSVTFNGVNLLDSFRCYVSGGETFGSPSWDYEAKQVPGRDGDLLISNSRVDQYDLSYDAFIGEEYATNLDELREFLMQDGEYHKLVDTYHPGCYMYAKYKGGLEPEVIGRFLGGKFTLEFSAIPRRYLNSGDEIIKVSSNLTIINPTRNIARPLIRVIGIGSFTVNDITVTLTENNNQTYVDCDIYDVYEGSANRNSTTTTTNYEFPKFNPGKNTVSVNGVTLEIQPRWYKR